MATEIAPTAPAIVTPTTATPKPAETQTAKTVAQTAPASSAAKSDAPKIDLKLGKPAEAAVETAVEKPKTDAELISSLAKATGAERRANAAVKDLQEKLKAATGTATEAQQASVMLEKIKKDPAALLELGIKWDDIVAAIAGKKTGEEITPAQQAIKDELDALKKRNEDRDKKEADEKTALEKKTTADVIASDLKKIKDIVDTDGKVADKDGFERWAIVSQDPDAVQYAYDAVVKEIQVKKLQCTEAQGLEMVRQALDQLEEFERKKLVRLKRLESGVNNEASESKATVRPREELPKKVDDATATAKESISRQRPRVRASTF